MCTITIIMFINIIITICITTNITIDVIITIRQAALEN